jgi:nitroimidazol reductase NimA-like FMN-containing flavoprotein (pyridoxamine 5'-phosphate oxidase superfamily)
VSFGVVTKSEILANKFDTDYESAIVFGTAIEVTGNLEKEDVLVSIYLQIFRRLCSSRKKLHEKILG